MTASMSMESVSEFSLTAATISEQPMILGSITQLVLVSIRILRGQEEGLCVRIPSSLVFEGFCFSSSLLYESGLCENAVHLLAAYTVQSLHGGFSLHML